MKVQEGLILGAIYFSLAYSQLVKGQPRKDCLTRCGNVTIEYPFGISQGCYYAEDRSFNITCNEKDELIFGDNKVINISHNGELRVWVNRSYTCYNIGGSFNDDWLYYTFTLGNLTLSDKNRFTAVGCDTYAFLRTYGLGNYSSGCMSVCDSLPEDNGECSGKGCCQTSVPRGNKRFSVRPYSFSNHSSVHDYNPCSYAFLVENGAFHFNVSEDLKNLRNVTEFPVVFDWSIGNQTCQQIGNKGICGGNSTCFDSSRGIGYNCKCLNGFDGNPYLSDGCKDINECTDPNHKHNCLNPRICENTIGSFECKCPSGKDINTTSINCTLNEKPKEESKYLGWPIPVLGTAIACLLILLVVSYIQQRIKHQKNTELRQKFFEQNGGGMLLQRLSGAGPSNVDVKIFTEEGMKEATNGYDDSRILGQGGQGTVYKGILPDNSIVAIKKARLGDSNQVEQFINEVLVLSKINHRNVVKLLGCCLETEFPLLVYEFITSGTLFDHLHGSMCDSLTWEHRLRIAIEVAGTLAYLHSSASIPIIHRDVKTANILLDENLTAKVADFGASRLIPRDKEELATMVQGTLGYLDPEYYNTGLLNEKSDVYSFGVVLMELLSGRKALCFEQPHQSKHLVSYFASATKENRLHEVIDEQVMMNEHNQREIQKAAKIAIECTRVMGEERPTMKEVAAELEALRETKNKHQWPAQYPEPEGIEHLFGVENLSAQGVTSSTGYDSIQNVAVLDIEAGR